MNNEYKPPSVWRGAFYGAALAVTECLIIPAVIGGAAWGVICALHLQRPDRPFFPDFKTIKSGSDAGAKEVISPTEPTRSLTLNTPNGKVYACTLQPK